MSKLADELRRLRTKDGGVPELMLEAADALDAAEKALAELEPHLDRLICYASTAGEYPPNAAVEAARAALAKLRNEGGSDE